MTIWSETAGRLWRLVFAEKRRLMTGRRPGAGLFPGAQALNSPYEDPDQRLASTIVVEEDLSMSELLFIYDTEVNWASTTHGRRGAFNVGVSGGIRGLKGELDKLVADGKTFERVMFYTHGNVGAIFFGDEKGNRQIDVSVLPDLQKYNVLFPFFCRMYFAGCNVADGDDGWRFLETAGRVFLPKRGGVTFGWTSKGFFDGGNLITLLAPLPSLALSGHEDHLWGDARYVFIGPGGVTVQRWSESAVASMI